MLLLGVLYTEESFFRHSALSSHPHKSSLILALNLKTLPVHQILWKYNATSFVLFEFKTKGKILGNICILTPITKFLMNMGNNGAQRRGHRRWNSRMSPVKATITWTWFHNDYKMNTWILLILFFPFWLRYIIFPFHLFWFWGTTKKMTGIR